MPGWVFRVNVCVPEAASDAASVEGDDDEEVVVVKPQDDKEKHWLPQRLQLHALHGHSEEVRCVAWSPDSKLLASGADDSLVHVWNVHSGEAIQILRYHFGGIFALEWAPKGDFLASR
jgi:WD40 repeat protein